MKLFILMLFSPLCFAESLNFEKFLNGVEEKFPALKIQLLKIEIEKAKALTADGAFDTTIQASGKKYYNGYYDAEFYEAKINKPLAYGNSNVAIGHRKSGGYMPVYYEENTTHERGEYFVSFNTQLFRYREIDPRRYKRFTSKNKVKIEKFNTSLKLIDVKVKASKVFWEWFSNFEKLKLYKNLVELNEKRFSAIKERVRKKDLAKIYLVESEQYLLNFKSELIKLKAENEVIKNNLRFYYPDFHEKMSPAHEIPKNDDLTIKKYITSTIIRNRPEIQIFDLLTKNYELDIQYSEQKLKPKVGLNFEINQSALNEEEKYGDEFIVGLKLEIPLETNLGEGDIARAKTNWRILDFEKKFAISQMENTLNNLGKQILGYQKNFVISHKELNNAEKLQNAEWVKFNAGASNFFLVNTRDMNYAKARIKLIEIYSSYKKIAYELDLWSHPPAI